MAIIEKGTFFLDPNACRNFREKPKYFIVLTDGESEDDKLICFSLNTEHRMDIYHVLCNKSKAKFILSPDIHKFSFLKKFTYIKLDEPCFYTVEELFGDQIKVFEDDIASIELLRQIKNCIDYNYLLPKQAELIRRAYP